MKSGNVQAKQSMSARPPVRSVSSSLSDLERVDSITEVPAKLAAETLVAKAGQGATAVKQASAKPVKKQPVAGMPWELVEEKGVAVLNFKFPKKLAAKLKYIAETTYGETMTSIVVDAVTERIDAMMLARNLK